MTLSKKLTLSLASMAVLGLLAACSNQKAQTPESSASTQQSSSKVTGKAVDSIETSVHHSGIRDQEWIRCLCFLLKYLSLFHCFLILLSTTAYCIQCHAYYSHTFILHLLISFSRSGISLTHGEHQVVKYLP